MARPDSDYKPSGLVPSDPFDQQLERLIGLPGGAHTAPAVVQTVDFYGHSVQWLTQVVKTEEGETVFLTSVSADGSRRFVIPARVMQTIDRQRATVQLKVRRTIGRRLAEARGPVTFTPEQRAKALATRKRNAAARRARKGAK